MPQADAQGAVDRRKRFVSHYLQHWSPRAAALAAGYAEAGASVRASELLDREDVQRDLARRQAAQAERADIRAAEVLRELHRMAMSDVGDLFDSDGTLKPLQDMDVAARRAIASIETEEIVDADGVVCGKVRKVKLWSKSEAVRDLARHLGLLVDRVVVTTDPSDADTVAQLREYLDSQGLALCTREERAELDARTVVAGD